MKYLTREYLKSNTLVLSNIISGYTSSNDFKEHCESDRYYLGDNDVISERRKLVELYQNIHNAIVSDDTVYRNDMGTKQAISYFQDDVSKANHKLSHKYLYDLINQAKNYICGNPITVQYEDVPKKIQKEIDRILYTDNNFMNFGQECVKNALKYKTAWARVAIDSEGKLRIFPVSTKEIIPIEDEFGKLVLLIRFFSRMEYNTEGQRTKVEYAEVYDDMYKDVYVKQGEYQLLKGNVSLLEYGISFNDLNVVSMYGSVVPNGVGDINANNMANNYRKDSQDSKRNVGEDKEDIYAEVEEERETGEVIEFKKQMRWGKIPFIKWKYNDDDVNQLTPIKCFIDILDIDLSDLANNVDDIQDAIWVLENYQNQDINEFMNTLKLMKAVSVGEGGSAHPERIEIPTEARMELYKTCEKCIYKFGRGVDFTNRDNLGNSSGVALKWSYAILDEKADELENSGQEALKELFYFIFVYLKVSGIIKNRETYDPVKFKFYFDRNTILNNKEQADIAILSQQLLSRETAVGIHPDVKDVEREMELIKKDVKEFEEYNVVDNNGTDDTVYSTSRSQESTGGKEKSKTKGTESSTQRDRPDKRGA